MNRRWKDYGERIAQSGDIAAVNRGHDYVVHAARLFDGVFTTACGRHLKLPNEYDLPTYVSCRNCLRALSKD